MEPRIQYAKTSDGVSIAFWTLGKGGTPLLMTSPLVFGNISLEWQIPELRQWYERLAANRMLVRWDGRNIGMSERGARLDSLEDFLLDFDAVISRTALDIFSFVGLDGPGMIVVMYAARHPQRISDLVLWGTPVHSRGTFTGERADAIVSLVDRDWEMATEVLAHTLLGWTRGPVAHTWAEVIQQNITQHDFLKLFRAVGESDVTPLLPDVAAPTLVIHQAPFAGIEHSQMLASRIPNAQLAQLPDLSGPPHENLEGMRLVEEFLGVGDGRQVRVVDPLRAASAAHAGMTAILFADIAGSTALTERLGDTAFRAKARDLDATLRNVIREHAGTAIEGKLLGDGVLAVFTSARQAIEAALACARSGDDASLPLHLGLHAGDVIREDNNVYGGAVNIASRISGLSAPGELLVSDTVRSLARTSAGVRFEDRGEQELKGVGEPVRVWAAVQAASV
jgi:class 3 adenylate cyclase